jgi:hypothetical protein
MTQPTTGTVRTVDGQVTEIPVPQTLGEFKELRNSGKFDLLDLSRLAGIKMPSPEDFAGTEQRDPKD